MKTCQHCKEEFPIESFGIDNSKSDGKSIYCKSCCQEKNEQRLNDKAEREAPEIEPRWEWKPKPQQKLEHFPKDRDFGSLVAWVCFGGPRSYAPAWFIR